MLTKTTLSHRHAVSRIVEQYRILAGNSAKQASLRQFADSLSEALESTGRRVSYQSVKNWQDRIYLPDHFVMLHLSRVAHFDWRGDFAMDILAAIHPEKYNPASEIGRRALKEHHSISQGVHNGSGNGNGTKAHQASHR